MIGHIHAACAVLSLVSLALPVKVEGKPLAPKPAVARPGYWWVPNGPGEWALFLDDIHYGSCRPAEGKYMDYISGQWVPASCPVSLPPVAPVWSAPPRVFFPLLGGGCAGGRCGR